MGKKITTLFTALVLLLSLIFNAPSGYALANTDKYNGSFTKAEGISTDINKPVIPNAESNGQAALQSGASYQITVNGNAFSSNQDASGTGWAYGSTTGILELRDYSGTSITSDGDLFIQSHGAVTVTGAADTDDSDAIQVYGALTLIIYSGTMTLQGGTGGIIKLDGSGGDGGDGIQADSLYLESEDINSNFVCTGGYGAQFGGYGIWADEIQLFPAHAAITGGDCATPTNQSIGIAYSVSLKIGVCYMTVQAGNTNGLAIGTNGSNAFTYDYVSLIDEGYKMTFSPIIKLTLNGSGGTYNTAGSVSITGPYPTSTYLGDYVFTRSGWQQIGWTSGSSFKAIGDTVIPVSDMTLYASWLLVQSNTVLFIGNGGLINGNTYLKTTAGSAVSVPGPLQTIRQDSGTDLFLLGWTNRLKLTTDAENRLNSTDKWYLPGTTAAFSGQNVLYAEWVSAGNIICYDGCGGLNGNGSPAVVQAILEAGSGLELRVQDNMGFTKSGYTFTGWKDGAGSLYTTGQVISAAADLTVTNLTAKWARNYTLTLNGAGGTVNGNTISAVPSYDGANESLSAFSFEKPGYTLISWNTQQDGSGIDYPAAASITVTGDTYLYAQWAQVYNGSGPGLNDRVICSVFTDMFKTTVTLTAASLINETGSDMSLPVCYALYQGGRLVAVSVKSVAVTGAGLSDTSTLIYPNYVRPDSCKVFILNADASPAGPPFVCLFS